jgi:hypothetical protein
LYQISVFIKDEIKRKNRMKFWDLHAEFLIKCNDIQDPQIKIEALTWLLGKFPDQDFEPVENFKEDFYEMWADHIPEYKSEVVKNKRHKKIEDLGL